ncbi:MAG: hypothetical protein BWY85_02326 [Firmicutes bacterium ADurb.Bin506]|nr:MAG: hypothetical protein BWY85_02326 [Firmicutes bacterium ADurb.Bin506]
MYMPLGTQGHIILVLKERQEHPVTYSELASLTGYGTRTICRTITVLLAIGAIERYIVPRPQGGFRYSYKVVNHD